MQALKGSHELDARLERWVSAGLVDSEQAQAIARYEAERERAAAVGRPARAIALLGGLTLISGLGSIVAYNWDGIGAPLKLLGMGILLAVTSTFAVRARPRGGMKFEVAALVMSGLSLASLALVSQIYAQDGELWQLLTVWCALSLPFLLLTSSRFLSLYTFAAGAVTLLSAAGALDELVSEFLANDSEMATALVLYLLSILGTLAFQKSTHPERRAVGVSLFQLHLVALGAMGGLAFLADGTAQAAFLLLGALGILATGALLRGEDVRALGLGPWPIVAGLFAIGMLQVMIPSGIVRTESSVLGFLAFVVFFGAYFWAAERANNAPAVRLAVGLLGVRVVIASFELFENLLVTGAVLMALGTLALVLTRRRVAGVTPS